jgi:hypothetical protein
LNESDLHMKLLREQLEFWEQHFDENSELFTSNIQTTELNEIRIEELRLAAESSTCSHELNCLANAAEVHNRFEAEEFFSAHSTVACAQDVCFALGLRGLGRKLQLVKAFIERDFLRREFQKLKGKRTATILTTFQEKFVTEYRLRALHCPNESHSSRVKAINEAFKTQYDRNTVKTWLNKSSKS